MRAYFLILIEDLTAEWVRCDLAAFELRALELLRHMRWDMRRGCGGHCVGETGGTTVVKHARGREKQQRIPTLQQNLTIACIN